MFNGQQEGNNLFHSFEEFSIPEGMEAVFENSTEIQNIFARVTGNDASNIDGILSTQGDANLFFINPNGIIFGDNAQLNVGGSFIASTAESIQFDDDNQFSATNSDEPLLDLTGFPVGLGLGSNPGPITVNGNGNQIKDGSLFSPIDLANIEEGLSVKSGKTLALIGGNITFNAGSVNTKSGQVEIAAIDKGNLINFQPSENKWIFNYDKISNFSKIELSNALINTSGNSNGFIQLRGSDIKLTNGSLIFAQNIGQNSFGDIDISATKSLIVTTGESSKVSKIGSETNSEGNAANINIFAQDLIISEGGGINSKTFGAGKSGSINVNVSNSAQLFRTTAGLVEGRQSGIGTLTIGSGDAGSVFLSASEFKASNGAVVGSSALSTGRGGDIKIKTNSSDR